MLARAAPISIAKALVVIGYSGWILGPTIRTTGQRFEGNIATVEFM